MQGNNNQPIARVGIDVGAIQGQLDAVAQAMNQTAEGVARNARRTANGVARDVREAITNVNKARTEELSAIKRNDAASRAYWQGERNLFQEQLANARLRANNNAATLKALRDAEHEVAKYNAVTREAETRTRTAFDQTYIDRLRGAYARLHEAQNKYLSALKNNDTVSQTYYQNEIQSANIDVQTRRQEADSIRMTAEAQERYNAVILDGDRAQQQYNLAVAATNKSLADRKNAQDQQHTETVLLEQTRRAYSELKTAQSDYIQALKDGDKARQAQAEQEANDARARLTQLSLEAQQKNISIDTSRRMAEILKDESHAEQNYQRDVQNTIKVLNEKTEAENRRLDKENEARAIQQVTDAYRRLKEAYQQALKAQKNKDTSSRTMWLQEAQAAETTLNQYAIFKEHLDLTNEGYEKISNTIQDAKTATAAYVNESIALNNQTDQQTKNLQNMEKAAVRWIATMVVMRGLRSMWNNMVDFAKEYYDQMNEIRIVTGKTEEEAERLADRYNDLARELKVSSTDVASAAITYFRQGLSDAEVEDRLKYTTMYAKVAGLEFTEAAELITAATNGMGESAEHVTDVWLYLGDHAATTGKEIGVAMQKVAASSSAVGVSFEKLGAYIATMSAKTRQAPEVIGTALNALFGRLQQIKEKGFNEEDETRINDIAKALATVDIQLMDSEGNWRDFEVILEELAGVWDTLTDKEQSYITTTMGGTRQRNYLLTLLNDLAQAADGNSQAMELYNGVMQQQNTTLEKYATWQESVAAAQGAWTAEVERFQMILSGSTVKDFLNILTGILSTINDLTEATGGWNIKIGVAAAAITALILLVGGLKTQFAGAIASGGVLNGVFGVLSGTATAAAGGVSLLNIALSATVVGAIAVAIVGLIGLLTNLGQAAKDTSEKVKQLNNEISAKERAATSLTGYIEQVSKLASTTQHTNDDIESFNNLRSEIVSAFPELENVLQTEVSDVNELDNAYKTLIGTLEAYRDEKLTTNWADAYRNLSAYQSQ